MPYSAACPSWRAPRLTSVARRIRRRSKRSARIPAGNTTSALAVSYLLDTLAPVAPTVTPVAGPGTTGTTGFSRSPSWSVTGVEPGAVISCAASGPAGAVASTAVSCGPTVTLNLNGLSDGTYQLTVTVTDAAGNATSAPAVSYLLDTQPPAAASVTPVAGPGTTLCRRDGRCGRQDVRRAREARGRQVDPRRRLTRRRSRHSSDRGREPGSGSCRPASPNRS